jgi:uncharacterized membrane protein YedE/YeeE
VLIDWTSFTPLSAAVGGLMIGAAAVVLLLVNGRIAGISGIIGGLGTPRPGDWLWRAAFVLGLMAAPWVWRLAGSSRAARIDASWPVLIVAGLLVGYGTRLGNGCTSGHGVCGLSNLSPRSLAAVLTFMAVGVLTVFALRHLP